MSEESLKKRTKIVPGMWKERHYYLMV